MKNVKQKIVIPVMLTTSIALLSGCGFIKPYDEPEFVEIKPNQTAFVIPLTGKTSNQGKFESEEYLKKSQVASKRIEIPHKWVKTGRLPGSGKWADTVRVIVVDRYPETRQWSKEKAFVGDSKDSIKFNQGISATAQIMEEDTSTFLYQYSGKKLKEVMDNEIHDKIGSVLLEEYSTMTINEIRQDKGKVIEHVRKEVEPYFKKKGITISNLGYVDDLKYLQADIQTAINADFVAQQKKKEQATINKKNEEQAASELKQAQTRRAALEELKEMKQMEINETIAKGLAEGKIKLPDTLVIGEDGNMIFDIPLKENREK